MKPYGQQLAERRARNAKSLAAFGVDVADFEPDSHYREIRKGNGTSVFTIGYERRCGEELVSLLVDAGVETLVDVREKAMSRKPDFRGKALRMRCEDAGISYEPMPFLGSTEDHRKKLKESGNIGRFQRQFRTYAKRRMTDGIGLLADLAKKRTVALICYERIHEDCHRNVIADLVADQLNATVIAIA